MAMRSRTSSSPPVPILLCSDVTYCGEGGRRRDQDMSRGGGLEQTLGSVCTKQEQREKGEGGRRSAASDRQSAVTREIRVAAGQFVRRWPSVCGS